MKHERMIGALAAAVTLGLVVSLTAQEAAAPAKDAAAAPAAATCGVAKDTTAAKAQTLCPVCGNKCTKDSFVDVEGCRIYGCCKECVEKIKADTKAAIAKIKANGETPEIVKAAPAEKSAAPAEAAAPAAPAAPAEAAK